MPASVPKALAIKRRAQTKLFDRLPIGGLILDGEGRIEEVNQLLCTWLSRGADELIGSPFTDLLPVGQRLFYANHQALVETIVGGARELSYDLRRADRSLLPVFVTTERLEGGKQVYCIYRAENRRRYEQQLLEAKKTAERATEARAEFVRTVTHELRTPVHAIASMAELLGSESLTEAQWALVGRLTKSTQQLSDLINDLLDLSKAESGKLVLNQRPTSASELCEELAYGLRPQAAQKRLTIAVDIDDLDRGRWFELDDGKVRQVLTNLLGNAIKFTDEGGIRLSVRSEVEDEPEADGAGDQRSRLTFAVEDSGVGIAPEDVDRIFEAFEQSAGGQTRRDSSGLGLSIGRHMVALLGGDLGVESQLGVGTRFYFTIPAALSSPPVRAEDLAGGAPRPPSEPQSLAGLRVLHVDDNETNRFIARRHLTSWRAEVTEAPDGLTAVALANARPLDMILLDLRLPDISGAEVARRVRKMPHHRDTPIYALSASEVSDDDLSPALFSGRLNKPYSGAALYALLAPHDAFRQNDASDADVATGVNAGGSATGPGDVAPGEPTAAIDFKTIEAEFAEDPEALSGLLAIMAANLAESRGSIAEAVAAGALSVVDDYRHRYGTTLRLLAPQPLIALLLEAGTPEPGRDNAALAERLAAALDATVRAIRERVG